MHAEYPELLAEMYAYSIAAAHLKLPHTNLENYMTSDVGSWAEGWPFVDQMNSERFCNTDLSHTDYTLPVRTQFDPFVYEPAGFTTGGPVYIRCKPSTLDFSSLTDGIYMMYVRGVADLPALLPVVRDAQQRVQVLEARHPRREEGAFCRSIQWLFD